MNWGKFGHFRESWRPYMGCPSLQTAPQKVLGESSSPQPPRAKQHQKKYKSSSVSSGLLTCARSPGWIWRGWAPGAWVTMGTAFSIRTEYPACFEGEACNPVPPAQKVQHYPPTSLLGTGVWFSDDLNGTHWCPLKSDQAFRAPHILPQLKGVHPIFINMIHA